MEQHSYPKREAKSTTSASGVNKSPKAAHYLQDNRQQSATQLKQDGAQKVTSPPKTHQYLADNRPLQKKANTTGMPDGLKAGVENLSGHSLDDVKVFYNSPKPAQLQAHAYAKGSQIHIAAGQEKHLPHEAWHVVQQKQGRVKATTQFKSGTLINDNSALENESDVMGAQAVKNVTGFNNITQYKAKSISVSGDVAQLGRKEKEKAAKKAAAKKSTAKKTVEEETQSDSDSDTEESVTTAAQALVKIFGIEEAEATTILEKTPQFNMLKSKNAEGLQFIVSAKGNNKRSAEGITVDALDEAREHLERFDSLKSKFDLDDDLAYFATHHSTEFEGLNPGDIESLDKIFKKKEKKEGEEESKEAVEEEEVINPDYDKDKVIGDLQKEQERFYANMPSAGGGGSGDWALGGIRKEAKGLAADSPDKTKFPSGKYTVHHKVARKGLKDLHKGMVEHADVSGSFKAKLETIGTEDLKGASNTQKILLNLPFNLEVGPPGDKRIGDPGSGIDLNKTESGAVTPRSEALQHIDSATSQQGEMGKKSFWDALAVKLEELRVLQQEQLEEDGREGSLLSAPKLGQWDSVGASFRRK
jgi:Domain of unknown function (DUF4157)